MGCGAHLGRDSEAPEQRVELCVLRRLAGKSLKPFDLIHLSPAAETLKQTLDKLAFDQQVTNEGIDQNRPHIDTKALDAVPAINLQPSAPHQIGRIRYVFFTGARRDPATCGTH